MGNARHEAMGCQEGSGNVFADLGTQTRNTNADAPSIDSQARFISRAAAVARPVGVRPTTLTPRHSKRRAQRWRRGWKSVTLRPVRGSGAERRAALRSEHETQATARFSATIGPPAALGTI